MRRHLPSLCETLELSSTEAASPWLSGLDCFLIYRQLRKRLKSGVIYANDSQRNGN